MKDTSRTDDWRSLCELVSKETDPQKLLELITKINRAVEECHQRNRTDESFEVDTGLPPISSSSQYDFISTVFQESAQSLEHNC